MRKKTKHSSGFTLIELLVVISIIGLLSSVVFVSFKSTDARARDAKRIAELGQIQKALQMYYNENQKYPQAHSEMQFRWGVDTSDDGCSWEIPQDFIKELEDNKYFSKTPVDPLNKNSGTPNTSYIYFYKSCDQQKGYILEAHLEKTLTTGGAQTCLTALEGDTKYCLTGGDISGAIQNCDNVLTGC